MNKFYIVTTDKPKAHYILELSESEVESIQVFMNKILNPEYAIGHKGTVYTILKPGYDSLEDAEASLGRILF